MGRFDEHIRRCTDDRNILDSLRPGAYRVLFGRVAMSDFIQWLGSRLKKDDSKVGAEETFEAGRKLGKKEGMERAAEIAHTLPLDWGRDIETAIRKEIDNE